MHAPRVTAYLDYRTFLRDWLTHQKREHPGYSYAAFAAAGGCSKATLPNVLSGARKPRPDTLDAFAQAMDLSPSDRNYLGLLAAFDAAPDVTRRREVLDRILASDRHHQLRLAEKEPEADVMRYLEHWFVPAIRELAALPGFREDPDWIASTLRPSIRPDQAQEALDTLFDLGFLRRTDDGQVAVSEVRFRTGQETWEKAAAHIHRSVVPHLLEALDTDNAARQHLLAATITLSPDQLPEVKQRLNALLEQVVTLGDDRPEGGPRAVYQFAVQLLPLSDVVGADGS